MPPTVAEKLDQIDHKLDILLATLARYEPLMNEAARRLSGPYRPWRKNDA